MRQLLRKVTHTDVFLIIAFVFYVTIITTFLYNNL